MFSFSYYWGTAANRLIYAVNRYITTGSSIGEGGVRMLGGGRILFFIPVNHTLPKDLADFECFCSRFEELASEYGTTLEYWVRQGVFDFWTFSIHEDQVDALAADLRARPGQRGWGSQKAKAELKERLLCGPGCDVGEYHFSVSPPTS